MALAAETENTSLQDSLRQKTQEVAKRYKASWIELGRDLYSIYKDKYFKQWGFLSFEGYCVKELGIKQANASKLLKSYNFLEREEPRLTTPQGPEETKPKELPNYESVNLLRLAKENQKITPQEYADIRESVLDEGREPKEVRAQVRRMLERKEEKEPGEARRQRRNTMIKRMITTLTMAKRELEGDKLLPAYLLKQIKELTTKLEDQIE